MLDPLKVACLQVLFTTTMTKVDKQIVATQNSCALCLGQALTNLSMPTPNGREPLLKRLLCTVQIAAGIEQVVGLSNVDTGPATLFSIFFIGAWDSHGSVHLTGSKYWQALPRELLRVPQSQVVQRLISGTTFGGLLMCYIPEY
mmetsp:Transcript_7187/g.26430  ORF Transcript_7187/g.26430 Transcript_7187/m.26430 type:complete len:144 (-) Transcript_7187:864-1295(-)